MQEGNCNPSVGSAWPGVVIPCPGSVSREDARVLSGLTSGGCSGAARALGSDLALCPGPRRDTADGQLLFDAWPAFVSGHLVPGLLCRAGGGLQGREFDGLVWLEGWGRGRVGFQLCLQVEREFGD